MKAQFDTKFWTEVLTGELKTIGHPNPEISREVRETAFANAEETIGKLAANTNIAYYKNLAVDLGGSTLFDKEFAYGLLKDMGRKVWAKELKLPRA